MRIRDIALLSTYLTLFGCTPPSSADDDASAGETRASETSTTASESSTDGSETASSETSSGETASDETSTDTGEEGCPTPLPPEAFDPDKQLSFGLWIGGLELAVGSSRQFQVGLAQCCYVWDPLETCSVYSVEPPVEGVTIDADGGLLNIGPDVPDSTAITVRADVEDGLAVVEQDVFIYDPALHPLEGFWHEVARIPCGGGAEFVPADSIGELYFTASGELGVTWQPFEIYVDYWADYIADSETGSLSFDNVGGNYVPDDIDADGSFAFEGDELVLFDMWLGSSQGAVEPAACGHRFAK